MAEFKVGCSPLTSKLFAGKVKKDGTWGRPKHDVTNTAVIAVAQHLLQKKESVVFTHQNGKKYKLQVVEYEE